MNLNIYYRQNDTGELLFQSLQNELDAVVREFKISSLDYMDIEIKDKDSSSFRTLNSSRIINNCHNKDFIAAILDINRIAYLDSQDTIIKSYEVLICDLACISVRVSTYAKAKEKTHYIKIAENNKVVEIAKRTAYVLGLDIAMVQIILTGKRRYKVKAVNVSPILRKRDVVLITNIIKQIYLTDKILNAKEIKLGADPEFMLFSKKSNKMLSASRFFPREGIVGCDNIRIPNRQQRPIAELRPKPDISPIGLMANIKYALRNAYRMAPYHNVKWIAGSQPGGRYSIGGHIHFSNIKLNFDILRALDNYVGIPVFLIENPVSAARRRRKYGYLGDYRIKDYGGFEYRTPGSWLVSPDITLAILCLAKIVTANYAQLPKKYLDTIEAQKAFYEGNQDFFRNIFDKLWANIKKTDMYQDYEEELKIIPYMINNNLWWDENNDFSEQWKLNVKQYKKNKKKKAVNALSKRINEENSQTNPTVALSRRNRRSVVRRMSSRSNTDRITDRNFINTVISIPHYNENRENYVNPYGQIISPGQVRRGYIRR